MKTKLILFSIVAAFLSACNTEKVDYTLISGKLEGYSSGDLKIAINRDEQISLNVAEDGSFSDTLKVKQGAYYLGLDKQYLQIYAIPGGELVINANADQLLKTASVSGTLSGMTQYLVEKSQVENANRANRMKPFMMPEDSFLIEAEKLKVKNLEILASKTEIPDTLRALEEKSIEMDYLTMLNYYPAYRVYLTKNENFEASDVFKVRMSNFDKNDKQLFNYSQSYKGLLSIYVRNKAEDIVKSGKTKSSLVATVEVTEELENVSIREEVLFGAYRMGLDRDLDMEAAYKSFMAASTSEENKKEVTDSYNKLTRLDEGKPSPRFTNYENYSGGTSSLDDFKGKYVYIDVWATWCGPCKAEIPFLKEVEKKYHHKNIVFVSISVDREKDKPAWEKMIEDKEMGGVQLFATDKQFSDDYVVTGIPRFILIDPKGNIVRKDAPRPSDPKLIELLTECGL